MKPEDLIKSTEEQREKRLAKEALELIAKKTGQTPLNYTPENIANKDTDGTLASNSDAKYPSQKAVKFYVDNTVTTVADASTTVKGISKLSVAPASPTEPIAVSDTDPRNSNPRTPTAHASSHTNGTDDIQNATALQKGLLAAADWVIFNSKASAADITAAVSALVDSSPGTLDTLNEIAAALADDPNFATTIINALANKQPLDSDLTAIAGLIPSNDDILQRKAGAWINRTIAQVKADLAVTYNLPFNGSFFSPADSTTYVHGGLFTLAPVASSGGTGRRIYIPKTGTLVGANVYILVATTLGSAENVGLYVRLNNTSDITLTTTSVWNSTFVSHIITGLSQAVTAGDYVEIKTVTPAWATNPIDVYIAGNITIQQ